jgi:hypothetical protein
MAVPSFFFFFLRKVCVFGTFSTTDKVGAALKMNVAFKQMLLEVDQMALSGRLLNLGVGSSYGTSSEGD